MYGNRTTYASHSSRQSKEPVQCGATINFSTIITRAAQTSLLHVQEDGLFGQPKQPGAREKCPGNEVAA